MIRHTTLPSRVRALAIVIAIAACSATSFAQAPKAPAPAPATKKPAPAPATAKPAPKPAAPAATAAAAPKPAPASDVRFTAKYTNGDQVTQSAAFIKGQRERYEVADTILLRQHDQKRTVQISKTANTYLVSPEGLPAPTPPAATGAPAKAPGVVVVATTIVDTGERKEMFGHQARHVKSMIDRQPQAGACDQSKQRIETDGWYIDMPAGMAKLQDVNDTAGAATTCNDQITATQNGDPKAMGFPLSYTTTLIEQGNPPSVVSMEVTAFEITNLDNALFEIPAGMTAALNQHELSKAVSDANEKKLAAGEPVLGAGAPKKPGLTRIGVPDVTNKTTQEVDTRALRTKLIAELTDAKYDAVPMAAAPQSELQTRAKEMGLDYLLIAEVAELKASKPGGLSKMMKATAGENANKDVTEAKLSVQLVAPGVAKPRLSTNASGKEGGVGIKTGLGLAKVAGTLYLKMMSGGMYGSPLSAYSAATMMNMGGMGMLGDPSLMYGMGKINTGIGLDRTAGAATFLMQQAMLGASAPNMSGGPSFDASLGDALEDAAKSVVDNLKKK